MEPLDVEDVHERLARHIVAEVHDEQIVDDARVERLGERAHDAECTAQLRSLPRRLARDAL